MKAFHWWLLALLAAMVLFYWLVIYPIYGPSFGSFGWFGSIQRHMEDLCYAALSVR